MLTKASPITERQTEGATGLSVAVVGAGIMGRGIVQILARAGVKVYIFDGQPGKGEEAAQYVREMFGSILAKDRMTDDEFKTSLSFLNVATDLKDIAGVDIVIEAIVEDLAIKRALFKDVEAVVSKDAVLATNTSSLLVTEIAAGSSHPERVAGLHFFNPVPLMRLVEVIPGEHTDSKVIERLVALVKRVGHRPVIASDSPGFLVNHAGRGLYTEGIRIVSEGVASFDMVDRVAREGMGFKMGPFELFDLTGLDVSFPVLTKIYQQFYEEPRFRPQPMLRSRVAAGLFGKKVGRGFYTYADGKQVAINEPAVPTAPNMSVWIAPDATSGNRGSCALLTKFLQDGGIKIDAGGSPAADSIVLIAPLGTDATTAASRAGLPLPQCMAIDTLFWPTARITLMQTVATSPAYRDALHAMLARITKVSVINDSTGFIAQRIAASIVNIGCDIAQQRIASPDDINLAVELGLGYPAGPLKLGDKLGPDRILAVLDGIHSCNRDPRYRPSPWLARRALARISLGQSDP
jgi:3-hydroxybutyryl-CoA dehydrogenase